VLEGVEVSGLSTTGTRTGCGFVSIETVFEGIFVTGLSTSPAKIVHGILYPWSIGSLNSIDLLILAQMIDVFNVLSIPSICR